MANWKVTKTTKHGKPIDEYTAKIGKDQWKIDSMPHIGPNFGSLYRWDDLRGLRQISTGNIEMLKQQAEGISTKKDAVSDLLRGFSRPGAKDMMEEQTEFRPGQSVTVLQGNKIVKGVIVKKIAGLDGGDYMVELPDPLTRERMMPQRVSAQRIRASRPGAKDMMDIPKEKEPFARIHPTYDTGPGIIDPYKTQIPIVLKDGSNVTAVRVDGRWSIKERPEIPARRHSRGIYGYIEFLNSVGFSRPGAKARFKVEDRFYFGKGRKERFADNVTYSIAAHIGSQPVGHRSVDSLEQAKVYAKQMLEAFKPNAKGKPLLVEVYPVVNYSPQPAVLTLRG